MRRNRSHQEGVALMIALFALMLILGAVAVVVHRAHVTKRHTDSAVLQTELDEACKAGIDFAIERVWNQYVTGNGNTTGNLASYRVFIDDVVDTNEDTNGSGDQDGGEWDADGSGEFEINDPAFLVNPEDNDPMILPSGSRVSALSVERFDDLTGTTLTIQSTAEKSGVTRTLTQTVRIAGELFEGFEYGILANNINCILCHAEFLNLDLERAKGNSDTYNTFDRIKIAALESLLIRTSEAESNVAGSVYTRGRVYDKYGNQISASGLANSTFNSYQFSSDNGKLVQNSSGNLSEVDLVDAGTDGEGRPNQFANLYLDYPSDENLMTDGSLPESFPAPFPDDDGDRNVSDDEFERVMNSANGSVRFELDPNEEGSIQGGVAYGVADGSAFSGNDLPTSSNEALVDLSNNGYYDGNLILIGNENDPIVIDNRVAVDGDVVIKGPVKGWGQLYVRGNAYIVGDVTYADASDEFGVADDGTENGFALTAGGSIMIGDYTTNRAKNNWKSGWPNDYIDPYVWQGQFIRMDQQSATATMSNGQTTDVGYFDDGAVDAGWGEGDEGMYSFTTSELMLFNRMEHLRAEADPSYTPRYYQLRDTAPIYEYITEDVTDSNLLEHSVSYFCPGVEVITDTTGAAVHTLNPKNYWLTEDQLRWFWWNDEREREAKGGRQPWKFDGLLYSNNSIFSVIRSNGRHKSRCYGTLEVRGSIVCADLGVLMIDSSDYNGTGLRLYYDKRVADFLRVEDTTQVEFRRVAMRY